MRQARGTNRGLALAAAALLVPVALMAYVLGVWRLASDAGVTGEFALHGLFSHWQVWIGIAVAAHGASSMLNRYGRGGSFRRPTEVPPQSRKQDTAVRPALYDRPRPRAR